MVFALCLLPVLMHSCITKHITMDANLRDVVLKPIINRCRNHQRKKRVNFDKSKSTNQSQTRAPFSKKRHAESNLGVEGVSTDTLDNFISDLINTRSLSTVAETKQEIEEHVSSVIHTMVNGNAPSWFNSLNMEDIQHLLVATDPISLSRTHIMSLPDTLSKLYNISNKEIQPTIFKKDHVWLTLQWDIDGVHNPFLSRPCLSTPCLGRYLQKEDGQKADITSLPEMVPFSVLDLFMEYRSQNSSTREFTDFLLKMRTSTKDVASSWGLGKDVWGQPKCLLCYLKDMFSLLADTKNVVKKEISLVEYQSCMIVQFEGIKPELLIRPEEHGFIYKLKESDVLLPGVCVPLPSTLVSLLYQKLNGEICVDKLYIEE